MTFSLQLFLLSVGGQILFHAFVGFVSGKNVTYDWTLKASIGDKYSPDCMNSKEFRRSLFLADNTFPGPLIEADEGDTIIIRIDNQNPSVSASIHFHGIHQLGTPYNDGAAYVTQCALGPLQKQEYVFTAYPPGTHYWHDHSSYNLADGLSGPMIIRPKIADPFAYDEERIIFLQDWYLETGMQQFDGLNSFPFIWVGNPNSLLINGKGVAPECQVGGLNYNNSIFCLPKCIAADPVSLMSSINITAGKTYRFRIINSGQLIMTNFAIAGHNITIVQADGTNVEPYTVSSIDITPGQRYDVILVASKSSGSYLIRTVGRGRNIGTINGTAILNYDGDSIKLPNAFVVPTHPVWNDTAFGVNQDLALKTLNASNHPTYSALSATNVKRIVAVGTQNEYVVNGTPQLLRWAMNNISNVHHSTPLIGLAVDATRDLEGESWPVDIDDTVNLPNTIPYEWDWTMKVNETGGPYGTLGSMGESVILLKDNEVVEIVLQNARALNGVAEFHPWHIHGHSFWVVGQGTGNYNESRDVPTYNLINPILRDTVILHPLGWVALRFVANNPGAWFFHCHIMSHHVMGMGFSLVTQPDLLGELPPSVQSCSDHDLSSSSGGEGEGQNSTGGGSSNRSSSTSINLFITTTTTTTTIVSIIITAVVVWL